MAEGESTKRSPPESTNAGCTAEAEAKRLLGEHPLFRSRTGAIQLECDHDTLIISGRVPSYYLKQVLQEAFRKLDCIENIENRVDVMP